MVSNFSKNGNKDFFNRELLFKTIGVALLLIVLFFIFQDYKIYQKKRLLTAQINNYKRQIEEIKKSSQNLKEEIANADNIDYLEKLAYEQLNEQRPGEKEVIFIAPQQKEEQPVEEQNFWSNFSGWLSGSLNWIKNKF